MCGISGIVGTEDNRALVQRMNEVLARRGPDSEGLEIWDGGRTTLGHRRLSIFDLSELGHQPMLSPDGKVGITFNGAIYNFWDLRRELEQLGHHFQSQCDTEVIVHGYQEWGIDRLASKMRGMFAIALWDQNEHKLILLRDRLGVKPLLYAVRGRSRRRGSPATSVHVRLPTSSSLASSPKRTPSTPTSTRFRQPILSSL
jgi:asparagine synthase (glutamine-hydrolysing)